jgi:uncharacterized protein YecE (DUF72 family)
MSIYVGVGGWVFDEWRDNFYPSDLPQKRELEYASRHLTAIEVNGTYYGSQTPESFARWHDETPEDFVFTLKGPRFATNRRVLAQSGPSIEKFLTSGLTRLKKKLGPINWQFMATKKFDPADFEAFLTLLPKSHDGVALRHAVEVRHVSFISKSFLALCRAYNVAVITGCDGEFPALFDVTADFIYVRLMGTVEKEKLGYPKAMLGKWAERARDWAAGASPKAKLLITKAAPRKKRDVFLFVISGAKARNPAAAMAIISQL